MKTNELVKDLLTVTKSGTTAFLKSMGTGKTSMSIIRQFGVGLHSAFLLANKELLLRRATRMNNICVD